MSIPPEQSTTRRPDAEETLTATEATSTDELTRSPAPAVEVIDLVVAGSSATLTVAAMPGQLTLWVGDDAVGTAELSLAVAGRFRVAGGSIRLLGRPAEASLLRRELVVARVLDAIEPEPRVLVREYMATCEALHGTRHNRVTGTDALADVGLSEECLGVPIEELQPADVVRVSVAGALLSRPVAIVADRVDRGLTSTDWASLCDDLSAAASRTGVAILASAARPITIEEHA